MRSRACIKELITPSDSFPAPTKPFHAADLSARGITIFFTSGAVDCLPPESKNDRRFMVVEAPKRYAHNNQHPVRPVASALLLLLVAGMLRGG